MVEVCKYMAKTSGDKNWIEKAIKHKGALRKSANMSPNSGKNIPAKVLTKLSHSKNSTTRKRANLAKTLRKFKK